MWTPSRHTHSYFNMSTSVSTSQDSEKRPAMKKSGSSSTVLPPVTNPLVPATDKSPRTPTRSIASSSHKSNAELEAASLDWVKPPMSKGVWMTYRDDGLLVRDRAVLLACFHVCLYALITIFDFFHDLLIGTANLYLMSCLLCYFQAESHSSSGCYSRCLEGHYECVDSLWSQHSDMRSVFI